MDEKKVPCRFQSLMCGMAEAFSLYEKAIVWLTLFLLERQPYIKVGKAMVRVLITIEFIDFVRLLLIIRSQRSLP